MSCHFTDDITHLYNPPHSVLFSNELTLFLCFCLHWEIHLFIFWSKQVKNVQLLHCTCILGPVLVNAAQGHIGILILTQYMVQSIPLTSISRMTWSDRTVMLITSGSLNSGGISGSGARLCIDSSVAHRRLGETHWLLLQFAFYKCDIEAQKDAETKCQSPN